MGAYLRTDTSTHMLCNLFPVLAVKTNCFTESIMLFIGPTASSLAVDLSCCVIFLVPTHLQRRILLPRWAKLLADKAFKR